MKKRWIGIVALFIATFILFSLYMDVMRKPKIETISLESIGIDRSTKTLFFMPCDGHKLAIVENYLAAERNSKVVIFNLTTKEHEEISDKIADVVFGAGIYGDLFVWSDGEDIEGYNMKTQEKFPISTKPDEREESPNVYRTVVVWESAHELKQAYFGTSWICGYDLKTGKKFKIADGVDRFCPILVGNSFVVWARKNGDRDIYGYNLKNKEEFPTCVEKGNQTPIDLWEDRLLYADETTNSTYVYNLTTGEKKLIENDDEILGKQIWEDYVALVGYEESGGIVHSSLYLYDMTTGEKRLIYEEEGAIPEGLKEISFITYLEMGDGVLVWMGGGYTSDGTWHWTDLHYTRI